MSAPTDLERKGMARASGSDSDKKNHDENASPKLRLHCLFERGTVITSLVTSAKRDRPGLCLMVALKSCAAQELYKN